MDELCECDLVKIAVSFVGLDKNFQLVLGGCLFFLMLVGLFCKFTAFCKYINCSAPVIGY